MCSLLFLLYSRKEFPANPGKYPVPASAGMRMQLPMKNVSLLWYGQVGKIVFYYAKKRSFLKQEATVLL